MRTILALALAANIFCSVGANYLQSAIAGQAGVSNTISVMASTTDRPAEQATGF